jgi:hypothetical protein
MYVSTPNAVTLTVLKQKEIQLTPDTAPLCTGTPHSNCATHHQWYYKCTVKHYNHVRYSAISFRFNCLIYSTVRNIAHKLQYSGNKPQTAIRAAPWDQQCKWKFTSRQFQIATARDAGENSV